MPDCIHCGGTGQVAANSSMMGAHLIGADQSIQFELKQGVERLVACPHCTTDGLKDAPAYRLGFAEGLKAGMAGREKAEELLR